VLATSGAAQGASTARNVQANETIPSSGSRSALAEPSNERSAFATAASGSAISGAGGAFATHAPAVQRAVGGHSASPPQARAADEPGPHAARAIAATTGSPVR
jgi:hypothetical protein